jgi:hypothetical protein
LAFAIVAKSALNNAIYKIISIKGHNPLLVKYKITIGIKKIALIEARNRGSARNVQTRAPGNEAESADAWRTHKASLVAS